MGSLNSELNTFLLVGNNEEQRRTPLSAPKTAIYKDCIWFQYQMDKYRDMKYKFDLIQNIPQVAGGPPGICLSWYNTSSDTVDAFGT